jgi:hypothetical protein
MIPTAEPTAETMPTPEPEPTIRLPEEIEAALTITLNSLLGWANRTNPDTEQHYEEALTALRATIRTALATAADIAWHDGYQKCFEDTKALRERAERLRTRFVAHWHPNSSIADKEDWAGLKPGDLADDILNSEENDAP